MEKLRIKSRENLETRKWFNKLQHIYTMKYHPAKKEIITDTKT